MVRRRTRTRRSFAALVALGWVTGAAPPSRAEEPPAPARRWFGLGARELSISAGYGLGFRTGAVGDPVSYRELRDVSIAEVVPRFGIGLTPPLGGESWYRGSAELLVEGALLLNREPRSGWAAGGGSTLRWNFTRGSGIVPFVEANLGVLYLDFDLAGQSDGFAFNVGFGTGLHWFVGDRTALTPGVRWQHLSNAGTGSPNRGINDVLFLLGVTTFFD